MPPSACSSADRQPTSASRMPSQCVDQLGRVRQRGDGRGRQREGRVGHPRFRNVPARICILAWGLSVFLVWCLRGVGEGRGLGVNEANVWRLDLTPKGFLSKQDIFDLDISVSAASLLHARSAL